MGTDRVRVRLGDPLRLRSLVAVTRSGEDAAFSSRAEYRALVARLGGCNRLPCASCSRTRYRSRRRCATWVARARDLPLRGVLLEMDLECRRPQVGACAAVRRELTMEISLVIPVLNEESSLPRLLRSIRQQTLQPAEIIFVDAGSTDKSLQLLVNERRADGRVRVVGEPGATPGRGRNIGIAAALNSWIALTDAGMELDPDWLKNL